MKKTNLLLLGTVLLGLTIGGFRVNETVKNLQEENEKLINDIYEVSIDYNDLVDDYELLYEEYIELSKQHDEILTQYNEAAVDRLLEQSELDFGELLMDEILSVFQEDEEDIYY